MKVIKPQHRTYLGTDKKTQYTQYRINIPDGIIKKLNWTEENQIHLKINNKKRTIILELKTKNQR